MLYFYDLSISVADNAREAAKKQVDKWIAKNGTSTWSESDAISNAQILSRLEGVQRVTVTRVTEINVGVYRDGRKSV